MINRVVVRDHCPGFYVRFTSFRPAILPPPVLFIPKCHSPRSPSLSPFFLGSTARIHNHFNCTCLSSIPFSLHVQINAPKSDISISLKKKLHSMSDATPALDEDFAIEEEEAALSSTVASTPLDEVRFPLHLDPALISNLQSQSLDDLRRTDIDLVEKGMNMFFGNRFREAEILFSEHYRTDCLVASAYGTLGTIRALLSMEQIDIDEACKRLQFASRLARLVSPSDALVSRSIAAITGTVSNMFQKASGLIGSWGKSSAATTKTPVTASPTAKRSVLTASQFRAEVVYAEAEVLRATLLLLQDSLAAYISASFALRRSYNAYARLERYITEQKADCPELDQNSINGVHFGLGCIHVVTSILPPKILMILKALGYMHNRDLGFQHLKTCLMSQTLRSPLASLFLLAFHGVLPSFAVLMIPKSLPVCSEVLEETKARYPVSVIHLWLNGRICRLSRHVERSTAVLDECLKHGEDLLKDLPQLQLFALYDQAWNYCAAFDWEAAAAAFTVLEHGSNWSKKMFSYSQAACYETLGVACWLFAQGYHTAARAMVTESFAAKHFVIAESVVLEHSKRWCKRASDAYRRSHQRDPTRLGGKVISVDQFISRRTETMTQRCCDDGILRNVVPLPGVELMLLFNILVQTPPESLERIGYAVDALGGCLCLLDTKVRSSVTLEVFRPDPKQSPVPCDFTPLLPTYEGEIVVLLLLRGDCLRDSNPRHVEEAQCIYELLTDTARLTVGAVEELKWVAPFAMYHRALNRYFGRVDSGRDAALTDLTQDLKLFTSTFGRQDYHFEMQMQFRLHLTQDFLRHCDASQ